MLAGLKFALIGAAVAFVVGGYAGWQARDWKCDAAAGKAQTQHDQRQLDAHDAASTSEATLFPAQEKDLAQLETKTNELRSKISSGECFTHGDVDRLRDLWPSTEK